MRILLSLFFLLYPLALLHAETHSIQSKEAEVFFEEPLRNMAYEVIRVYPTVKDELVRTVEWKVDFDPEIVLVKDRAGFRKASGSDLVVAFAMPDKNLIVLDASRVYARPFTLETTLRHELCHLLLHRNIERDRLPRWLDEGFCQWASGGVAELSDDNTIDLSRAVMSDKLINIRELEIFLPDERSLKLSYQESKSFVEYIVSEFGRQKILVMLQCLKEGNSMNESVRKSLSVSLFELENNWHAYLKRKHTWLSYMSNNIYTIIFFFAAIATIYGFFRLLQKKRSYVDEDEEGGH